MSVEPKLYKPVGLGPGPQAYSHASCTAEGFWALHDYQLPVKRGSVTLSPGIIPFCSHPYSALSK